MQKTPYIKQFKYLRDLERTKWVYKNKSVKIRLNIMLWWDRERLDEGYIKAFYGNDKDLKKYNLHGANIIELWISYYNYKVISIIFNRDDLFCILWSKKKNKLFSKECIKNNEILVSSEEILKKYNNQKQLL